jgi:hypothetical protein
MSADLSTLNEPARKAAEHAVERGLEVTSARRDKHYQAHAMASNLTRSWPTHKDWIKETYVHGEVSRQTQQWVDDWVDADPAEELTVDTCTRGLLGILDAASDSELVHLSWHLSGDAFDCQPGVGELSVLEGIVEKKTDFGASAAKLLTEEGGETRWHLQIR